MVPGERQGSCQPPWPEPQAPGREGVTVTEGPRVARRYRRTHSTHTDVARAPLPDYAHAPRSRAHAPRSRAHAHRRPHTHAHVFGTRVSQRMLGRAPKPSQNSESIALFLRLSSPREGTLRVWPNPLRPATHPTGPNRGSFTAQDREHTTVQPRPSPKPLGRRLDVNPSQEEETHRYLRRAACRSVPEGTHRTCQPAGRGRAGRWPGSSTGRLRGTRGRRQHTGPHWGPARPGPPGSPGDARAPGRAACGRARGLSCGRRPREARPGHSETPRWWREQARTAGEGSGPGTGEVTGTQHPRAAGRGPLPAPGTRRWARGLPCLSPHTRELL